MSGLKNTNQDLNAQLFARDFALKSAAAIDVMMVRTREYNRVQEIIQDEALRTEQTFYVWNIREGWATYPHPADRARDIRTPLRFDEGTAGDIHKAMKWLFDIEDDSAIFLMQFPHHFFEHPMVQEGIRQFAQKNTETDRRLVFVVPEGETLPAEIADDVHLMDFKAPSFAELRILLDELIATILETYQPKLSDDQRDTIASYALGMTSLEFVSACSVAFMELKETIKENKGQIAVEEITKIVLAYKVEMVRKTNVLEIMQAVSMDQVGGFDALKEWVRMRTKTYSEEAKAYGIEAPKGILCVGPPGTGKSLLAKATASVLQVPLIKFNVNRIFDKFVGGSEERISSALKLIDAMAPCVMLLDEIDKSFSSASGAASDGGVGQRVLGSFLTWMQDRDNNKSPVFVVMTANNAIGLPAELVRKGRVDEIFSCTFPTLRERMEILAIHLGKRNHSLPEDELRKVAQATNEYVGAELEAIVKDTLIRTFDEGKEHPTSADLISQASKIVTIAKAFPDKVKAMQIWAEQNAVPASNPEEIVTRPPVGTSVNRGLGQRMLKGNTKVLKPSTRMDN